MIKMEYRIETDIVLKPSSDSFLNLKNDLNLKDACSPENENIRYHDEIYVYIKRPRGFTHLVMRLHLMWRSFEKLP